MSERWGRCPLCRGYGLVDGEACGRCHGEGYSGDYGSSPFFIKAERDVRDEEEQRTGKVEGIWNKK